MTANPNDNPAPASNASAAAAGSGTQDAPPGEILVVEDNQGVATALTSLIRKAGFAAVACHTGADAINHLGVTKLQAAVLDIHLPDINGLILAHKLRDRLGGDVPIIIVSGDTSIETIKSLGHVGATHFFSKPLNPGALVERLKELVGPPNRASA